MLCKLLLDRLTCDRVCKGLRLRRQELYSLLPAKKFTCLSLVKCSPGSSWGATQTIELPLER